MSNFSQTLTDVISSSPFELTTELTIEGTSQTPKPCHDVRLFSEDESRIGTLPVERRRITLKGIKPISYVSHELKSYYLYGSVEPKTGESFFMEFPHLDSVCFQIYLDEFSITYPDSFNILLLDRGRFHKAKSLKIPSNIALLFLPAYSPELNPIERVWEAIKAEIANEVHTTIDSLIDRVAFVICNLSKMVIQSLTSYSYIMNAVNEVFQ